MTDRVEELLDKWRTELPEALVASSELGKRVMVLSGLLGEATRATVTRFDLTGADFDVLAALRRSGKPYRLKANELSRSLLLSTGGTSNVVNRLVGRGLVEREPDQTDGRSTYVRLTPRGRSLAEEVVIANSKAHDEVLAGIPAELLERATAALRELFEHLPR
ncbi:MarR family winged helix-turn-helix transcriptional regulator [Lentzea flava]|uniref:MarR family transcriptional regulator n=1 Tax=Lentzea flava TaxID=103732 RepID=A0ABQ2UGG4_9PSEU|nr:MarR family transcriptional regulator [Lentzea flava]MCP2198922.1 DNA-binding transcriptional regulator, MarR family [Lentzea flava]GGU32877.1 MarR family transcriptional regulator [Lentzea flava]